MTNITDIDKCKCSAISSKKKALKTLLYIFKRVMTSPLFNEDDIVKDIIVQSNRHFERSLLIISNWRSSTSVHHSNVTLKARKDSLINGHVINRICIQATFFVNNVFNNVQ
ncbi:uncharacterized protein BX663DRAFT_482265 [Cokeromyces recurvatus]|uniref:uncharacterized protein n=1 Tax=Cokeromyces recurvatus TaxID=90255 RepID=UPI00221FA93B|nr:uncharacterized protein BX663DRAFT_482265 [Cokeromyces recurvatus]KAI7908030.1 hypothetical protein BX663DRAFT_482265 [Cokeromyces recurvatus]